MSVEENKSSDVGILFIVIGFILIGFLLVAVLIPKQITALFININTSLQAFFNSPLFLTAKLIAGLLTVFLAALITWLFFKLLEMEKEHEEHVYHHAHAHEHEGMHHSEETPTVHHEPRVKTAPPPNTLVVEQHTQEKPGVTQWQSVLRLANSQNPSDWKLAIIEADVLLDTLTYMQGFPGETLGERLKNTDIGLFQTIKYARHAHGLRNRIAHTPDMELTPRDASQTIRMYEAVFKEFNYI